MNISLQPTYQKRTSKRLFSMLQALIILALLLGMIITTTAVQAQPALQAQSYHAYFSYSGLSVYDTDTKAYVTSIDLGGYTNPLGIATTPDNAYIYDVLNALDSVKVIETASNTVVATVAVGSNPIYVAITPDGAFAYITNGYPDYSVSVIQTSDNTVVATVPVGNDPFGVAITPDGDFAYIVNRSGNTISIIDTASNTVVNTITSGSFTYPQKLAFTPDGAFAYLTNWSSNNVLVIQTSDNSVVATVPVGEAPYDVAITPDGAYAYVTNYTYTASNSGSVSVIRTSDNTVVATIPLGGQWVRDVAITPDGEYAYVAVQYNPGSIAVIEIATNTIVYTFNFAGFGIAFASIGSPNQPPVADAGGPYSEAKGSPIALDGSGSSDDNGISTYEWDCTSDGSYEFNSTSPTGDACTYPESGNYTVTLRVTDAEGEQDTDTASATVVLDDFNQPDGGIGNNWSGIKNNFGISGNKLSVNSNNSDSVIYWKDQFGVNQEVYITLSSINPAAMEIDLLLKVQQGGSEPNWGDGVIEVLYEPSSNSVTVWTFQPSTLNWFSYPTIPVTFANGDRFGAQALASGDVVILKNGVEIGRVTMTPADQSFFNPRGGNIGLWFVDAYGTVLSGFGGGNLP